MYSRSWCRSSKSTATPVADELAAQVAGPLDELAVLTERGMPGSASSEPVHLAGPAEVLCVRVLPALAPFVERGLRLRVTIGLAVVAGAGITVLPRYLCAGELANGTLVPLLSPDDPPINTGFLAERAGAPERRQVTIVRDHLLHSAPSW